MGVQGRLRDALFEQEGGEFGGGAGDCWGLAGGKERWGRGEVTGCAVVAGGEGRREGGEGAAGGGAVEGQEGLGGCHCGGFGGWWVLNVR